MVQNSSCWNVIPTYLLRHFSLCLILSYKKNQPWNKLMNFCAILFLLRLFYFEVLHLIHFSVCSFLSLKRNSLGKSQFSFTTPQRIVWKSTEVSEYLFLLHLFFFYLFFLLRFTLEFVSFFNFILSPFCSYVMFTSSFIYSLSFRQGFGKGKLKRTSN